MNVQQGRGQIPPCTTPDYVAQSAVVPRMRESARSAVSPRYWWEVRHGEAKHLF